MIHNAIAPPATLGWPRAVAIWWSFFWRAMLYGLVLGALLGGMAGFYAALIGQPQQSAQWGMLAGWVATLPSSLLAIKHAVGRHLAALRAG